LRLRNDLLVNVLRLACPAGPQDALGVFYIDASLLQPCCARPPEYLPVHPADAQFAGHRLDVLDGVAGVLQSVERLGRAVLGRPVAIAIAGFFFLQVRRVLQQDGRQLGRSRRGPDLSLDPPRISSGREPLWSMWAWVRSTASRRAASNGSGAQLRSLRVLNPWNKPQSTSSRLPATSTRVLEPVTVPVAP